MNVANNSMQPYPQIIKPVFDRLGALVALLFALPLLLVLSLFVLMSLGRPVLFLQIRPGRFGKPFSLYKFRTMNKKSDLAGNLLADRERLTPFGTFLRALSLDELPELVNVLRGEMSFVGPRPLLMEYLERYSPTQARRHEVLPGITGWAQVNGRNALSWEEKLELDVWYADHQSFSLDMLILFKTVWAVLRREGISQKGHATAPEFLGTNHEGAGTESDS